GGIGKATARLFATRGVHLALHYHSQHDVATALVEELRALGVRVAAFQADLADFEAVRALHGRVVEELGHPDILYSNAAMAGTMLGINAKIEDVSLEEFERCWRANAGGAFLLTQLCVPHMEQQRYGRIVFCSSVATATGGILGPHYSSSKAALHGIMHWVAKQYSKKGVDLVPVGRFGQPEEIAQVVELLVTNSYMTDKV
ncbi:hypothetical protein BJV78DRAFT_1131256, partial [Lactifluus subvellereus]